MFVYNDNKHEVTTGVVSVFSTFVNPSPAELFITIFHQMMKNVFVYQSSHLHRICHSFFVVTGGDLTCSLHL